MASVSMRGNVGAKHIADQIKASVLDSGISCELVGDFVRNVGGEQVFIMVFEKYYYRVSNVASLSVVVTGDSYNSTVDAIGSGASQGVFLKFSYGTEKDFLSSVNTVLRKNNFVGI